MKKLMTAALAALMLAGALSAMTNATPIVSFHPTVLVGEGSAPFPTMLSVVPENESAPRSNQF